MAEANSESCQISKMERFAKIVNGFKSLTIFVKRSILDVWQCFKNASESGNHIKINDYSNCLRVDLTKYFNKVADCLKA